MSSKQLSSILANMPKATPAPQLSVVEAPSVAEAEAAVSAPNAVEEPVKPEAKATPQPAPQPKAKREAPSPKTVTPKAVAPEPELEPERPLQAYVPQSIHRAVAMRAAADDVTTRMIILQGLKAIGFEISEEQMRDRRAKS